MRNERIEKIESLIYRLLKSLVKNINSKYQYVELTNFDIELFIKRTRNSWSTMGDFNNFLNTFLGETRDADFVGSFKNDPILNMILNLLSVEYPTKLNGWKTILEMTNEESFP